MGNWSVSNLKFSIESKGKLILDKFIYSLGIRHIGMEKIQKLLLITLNLLLIFLYFQKNKSL